MKALHYTVDEVVRHGSAVFAQPPSLHLKASREAAAGASDGMEYPETYYNNVREEQVRSTLVLEYVVWCVVCAVWCFNCSPECFCRKCLVDKAVHDFVMLLLTKLFMTLLCCC